MVADVAISECARCKEVKDVSCFRPDPRMKNGLASWCKDCHRSHSLMYNKKLRERDPEGYLAKSRVYQKRYRDKRKATGVEKTDIETKKDRCRAELWKAIGRGDIRRMNVCELCKSNSMIEAHHVDYSKPLYVYWLCKACHEAAHHNGDDNVRMA